MNLLPLYDNIIVKRDDAITQVGAIVLAESARDKPNAGTVLAVGEGRIIEQVIGNLMNKGFRVHVEPLRVRVGDRILFQSYAGTEIKDESDPKAEILLMSEDDVLAIIQDASRAKPAPAPTQGAALSPPTQSEEAPSEEEDHRHEGAPSPV